QARDNSLHLYDAHECTGVSPCPGPAVESPPPCATVDACREAPAPQPGVFGAPSSATFSGPGNLVPSVAGVVKSKPVVKAKPLSRAQKLRRALVVCRREKGAARRRCERRARAAYRVARANSKKLGGGR